MTSKAVKIICFLLLPAILAGCTAFNRTAKITAENTESTETAAPADTTEIAIEKQPEFLHVPRENEPGTAQAISKYNDNYSYGVQYPATGNVAVDEQIKAAAEGFALEAEANVKDYSAGSAENRAIISTDYRTYSENDINEAQAGTYNYLSVVFETSSDFPVTGVHSKTINSCFFDLISGRKLSIDDVFFPGWPELISAKTAAFFNADPQYAELTETELFKTNTSPKEENFLKFVFYEGKAVFYFDRSRILPEEFGCLCVTVPVSELYSVLKIKISERAPIRMIGADEKLIALTFDDGPEKEYTNRILDSLEKAGGRATFFVLGLYVSKNPDALKREYLMGCDIGNHSYNHMKLTLSVTDEEILYQVSETDKLIAGITGEPPKLFRMPYGYNTQRAFDIINMPVIGWNCDSRDWVYNDSKNESRTEEQREADKKTVLDSVLNTIQDGDIVIMHDSHKFSAEVSEALIPELVNRGFRLVTVSELFRARGITLENAKFYRSARK